MPVTETWVREQESRHFRTHHDTGANLNAVFVWNLVRRELGMPPLTERNLVENYCMTLIADIARAEEAGVEPYAPSVEHLALLQSWLALDDQGLYRAMRDERIAMDALRRSRL